MSAPDSNFEKHPFPHQKTRVIHTRGTEREIGRQHAEQTKDEVTVGMARFYGQFWNRMLKESRSGKWWQRLGVSALDPGLTTLLKRQVDSSARERILGISEVTGQSVDFLMTTLILPDLLPLLEVLLARVKPAAFIRVSPPRFGCSSFIARGRNFLHGRNLDFPGVGYWDRYPLVQVFERAGELKYLGFTTAGVPFGGITGVNEAQVSVSLHQHYCSEGSIRGTLPFLISEKILSTATSLEQALSVLRSHRTASSWAFLVCDGKTREAMIYECHPNAAGLIRLRDEGILAHSNYFQTGECRPSEFATTARMNWDNYARRTRLKETIASHGNMLDVKAAAVSLSEHYDPYWGEEKPINRTVSQLYNIQSVIFDLEKMRAFVAEGDAPVHFGAYAEFDLGEIFSGREGRTGKSYPGYGFRSPNLKKAKQEYVLGFVEAFDGNTPTAIHYLDRSLNADFVPEVALVRALLYLKAGEFALGLALLERAGDFIDEKAKRLAKVSLPPEYFEIRLYQSRALDLLGRHSEAAHLRSFILDHPSLEDSNIRNLASMTRIYRAKDLNKLLMPFSSYVPFA